jgi:hypothetical protein
VLAGISLGGVDHIDRIIQAWRRERPDVDVTALGRFSRDAALRPTLGLDVVRRQLQLQTVGILKVDGMRHAVVLELEPDTASAEVLLARVRFSRSTRNAM